MVTIEIVLPDALQAELISLANRHGISEPELVQLALEQYVRTRGRTRPRSIGAGYDPDFKAEDTDEWLAANFRPVES
jgi:hypothetical protein